MTTASAEYVELNPKDVKVGWRARKDHGDISSLVESIKKLTQLQPIAVRKSKSGYYLIAGKRRLAACRRLKVKVRALVLKAADEMAALTMQMEENIKRKDFDKLEIGEGLRRYKAVYEKTHPETKAGATGGRGSKTKKDFLQDRRSRVAKRFTSMASKSLGISEALVYQLLEIADLPAEEKKVIDKAPSKERNKIAQRKLRDQRNKRKEEKLDAKAKEKQAERKKVAKKTGKKPRKGPTITLHHGDMRKLLARVKDRSVDLLLTDPPYDLKRSLISHAARGSINTPQAWDKLDVGWVLHAARKVCAGGTVIAFCPGERIGDYEAVFKKAKLDYHGFIIWHRTNPGTVHRDVYLSSCDAIVWASKPGAAKHFRPWRNAGAREVHNCIEGPICMGNERLQHSAQKPEWLIEQLIKRHATRGHLVFDPFCGVGTTLAVCKRLRLECIGIELEEKFCKLAAKRLAAL